MLKQTTNGLLNIYKKWKKDVLRKCKNKNLWNYVAKQREPLLCLAVDFDIMLFVLSILQDCVLNKIDLLQCTLWVWVPFRTFNIVMHIWCTDLLLVY